MLGKLVIRTLIYDRGKLIAALVGVIFSVEDKQNTLAKLEVYILNQAIIP